jgi:hypothetical protein
VTRFDGASETVTREAMIRGEEVRSRDQVAGFFVLVQLDMRPCPFLRAEFRKGVPSLDSLISAKKMWEKKERKGKDKLKKGKEGKKKEIKERIKSNMTSLSKGSIGQTRKSLRFPLRKLPIIGRHCHNAVDGV